MFTYDPCRTKPINYQHVFQKHVVKKLNLPDLWPAVAPTFQKLDSIRATFDWLKLTSSDMYNKPELRIIQDNMEIYLQHCIFLSTKFKFSSKEGVTGFLADWEMNLTKKKIQSGHILFEIACFLLNYAVLNYNQSTIALSSTTPSKQELKTALEKLRYAKWACLELKKLQPELSNHMQLPLELRESSVDFMVGMMEGLSYMCFFKMLSDGSNSKVTEENLASLEREIAKWFFSCRQSFKQSKDLRKQLKQAYPEILSHYYNYSYQAVARMARLFAQKHEAQVTKGFIGIQFAYMKEAETLIAQMGKDDDFPAKSYINKLYKKEIKSKLAEVEEKIQKVYKCQVPKSQDLNYIQPVETKITPIEPKNIRVPPKDANAFGPFLSEQLEGVKSAVQLFISNKKSHVQKTLFDLKEAVRDIKKNYNVDLIVNAAQQKDIINQPEFQTMLKQFREKNKGKQGYLELLRMSKDMRSRIENELGKIDGVIQNEQKKDHDLEQAIGQQGMMIQFTQANQGEIDQVNRKKKI